MNSQLNMTGKYIFLSYSTKNESVALEILNSLEQNGNKCFYAPRDIEKGKSYAGEVISAIDKADVFVLVLTQEANDSIQVLREVNAAVSRNKLIVPLRFGNVNLNKDMQYYLGVCQWIDMDMSTIHQDMSVLEENIAESAKNMQEKEIVYKGTQVVSVEELLSSGLTAKQIAMREVEIDYLCIPTEKFNMSEEYEGSLEDWEKGIELVEFDISACLVKDDLIIGYCDIFPLIKESYQELLDGKSIIRDDMIDVYGFGGHFPAYIAMMGILPDEEGHANYLRLFDWLFAKLVDWKKHHIYVDELAISVYSDLLERFVLKLGFEFVGQNPVGGKIYATSYESLLQTEAVQNRYGDLDL